MGAFHLFIRVLPHLLGGGGEKNMFIFCSFVINSAFYGRFSCIHCKLLFDLQIKLC